jgi:hypothetical protein
MAGQIVLLGRVARAGLDSQAAKVATLSPDGRTLAFAAFVPDEPGSA